MEFEEGLEPVSPTGQYFNSSVLSVSIIAVLEFENQRPAARHVIAQRCVPPHQSTLLLHYGATLSLILYLHFFFFFSI